MAKYGFINKDYVADAIEKAERGESKVSEGALNIQGWSSNKVKHLLNNLCSHPDVAYLEVGVWKGSTFIPALYQNVIDAVAVDNFSQHWGDYGYREGIEDDPEEKIDFINNTLDYLYRNVTLLDMDFLEARKFLDVYNVYMYDGDHSQKAQAQALTEFLPHLTKRFVYVVDDFNVEEVRLGTQDGIKEVNLKEIAFWHLPAYKVGDEQEWWNGIGVYVLEKQK